MPSTFTSCATSIPSLIRGGLLLLLIPASPLVPPLRAETAPAAPEPGAAPSASLVVTADSIILLTYSHNQDIAAARYDMEAAQYAFRQFERQLSQFTPLLWDSRVERDVISYRDGNGHRHDYQDHYAQTRVGARKEFFNGASIFGGAGVRSSFGEEPSEGNPFAEGEIRFPLFSSFTTLNRITARSFEENEMLNARLDYVEEVRDRIQMAQEYFYWFQRAQDRRDLAEATIRSYQRLLDTDRARQNPSDAAQIRDAIQSAQSNLVDAVGDINTYRISLMDQIGLETLEIDQIDNVTLIADDYYGKGYLAASREELTESAVANDAEIRVLENALENALLKRRLAEQGKWDIFGSVFGRQDLRGEGNPSDPYGYEVGVGLNVKLNDPKLLKLSTQRADADASKFKAEITRRSQQVRNLIDRRLVSAISQRAQLDANKASVISREAVFQQKVADYIDGRDTIDNLINAQVNLFQTQRNTIDSARFFFEEITELDQLTGVYFTVLGIKIEVGAELDDM